MFRPKEFWTCGFFPGSIYSLIERLVKYPQACFGEYNKKLMEDLLDLRRTWSDPVFATARRTDTHNMSFMMQPAMRVRWETLHDARP